MRCLFRHGSTTPMIPNSLIFALSLRTLAKWEMSAASWMGVYKGWGTWGMRKMVIGEQYACEQQFFRVVMPVGSPMFHYRPNTRTSNPTIVRYPQVRRISSNLDGAFFLRFPSIPALHMRSKRPLIRLLHLIWIYPTYLTWIMTLNFIVPTFWWHNTLSRLPSLHAYIETFLHVMGLSDITISPL